MSDGFLKRLYWACATGGRTSEKFGLGSLYEHSADVEAWLGKITDFAVNQPNLNRNEVDELESLACEATCAFEEQGFINGFRMAMKLILDID